VFGVFIFVRLDEGRGVLIFHLMVEQLTVREIVGAQDRSAIARARLTRDYHIREMNVFFSHARAETKGDGKFELSLVFDECIQCQQFDSLLRELSQVVGIDLGSRCNHASSSLRGARASLSTIII
jgi:hypothetical protein